MKNIKYINFRHKKVSIDLSEIENKEFPFTSE